MAKYVSTVLASLAATALNLAFTPPAHADGVACSELTCNLAPPYENACRLNAVQGSGAISPNGYTFTRRIIDNEPTWDLEQRNGCLFRTERGLQGFVFSNDDRSLERVGVLPQHSGGFDVTIRSDRGPEGEAVIWTMPLPDATFIRRLSFSDCRGSCTRSIDDMPEGTVPVLAGFELTRFDGAGHLRRIGIQLQPDGRSYRVDFADTDFPFFGVVVVALIPQEIVQDTVPVAGNYNGTNCDGCTFAVDEPNPRLLHSGVRGDTVLQSFYFEFRDGGQYLHRFGLERLEEGYYGWFQNSDSTDDDYRRPDDRFRWSFQYVVLQEPEPTPDLINTGTDLNPDPFIEEELTPVGPLTIRP